MLHAGHVISNAATQAERQLEKLIQVNRDENCVYSAAMRTSVRFDPMTVFGP